MVQRIFKVTIPDHLYVDKTRIQLRKTCREVATTYPSELHGASLEAWRNVKAIHEVFRMLGQAIDEREDSITFLVENESQQEGLYMMASAFEAIESPHDRQLSEFWGSFAKAVDDPRLLS